MEHHPHFNLGEEVKTITKSQNKFARELYVAFCQGSHENLFFSPFSVATMLSMIYVGSKGNTESQMQSVMHLPSEKSAIQKAYQELISEMKKEVEDYELRTSNMVYISNKTSVTEDFASVLVKDFLSIIKAVDFSQSEPVRQEINGAVEKETNSKIKNIIASGVLTELTRMALVNAIYFKGMWSHPFNPSKTRTMPFWVAADKSTDVQMMSVEKDFKIVENAALDATVLDLDYKGDQLSMVIVLPNKRDGLASLEEKMPYLDLGELDTLMTTRETLVYLPKFKLEQTIDLVPVLSKMGMTDLFTDGMADLSGISGKKDLVVSNVIHKASLEVNEEGSEAAAATTARSVLLMLNIPVVFKADHPFLFYIREKSTHAVLFAGRFIAP